MFSSSSAESSSSSRWGGGGCCLCTRTGHIYETMWTQRRNAPVPGSCWRCARAGCDGRVPPTRGSVARASPVRRAVRPLRSRPRPRHWVACPPRWDLLQGCAGLAVRREQRRPARCADVMGTAGLAGFAEAVGQLFNCFKSVGIAWKERLTYRLPT